MDILFIGGTGVISSACSRLAVRRGFRVTLLHRGLTRRPVPDSVETIRVDAHDEAAVRALLGSRRFDAVVDWIAFTPEDIERDLALYCHRTEQFIFISSASAYQTPPERLPVSEDTPLSNPHWQYSRNKIACEERLHRAERDHGFPVTVVRPSHTYDPTMVPLHGGWTTVDRIRRGRPVIVHGDGSSLWVLTHHEDFAVGLVGLLSHPGAIGETVQITSDEVLTWDRIARLMGEAAGREPDIVHVPSDLIAAFDPEWGASLLGDKTHSMVFDNSKIRRLVPDFRPAISFSDGARQIVEWHDADPSRRRTEPRLDALMDRMVGAQRAVFP